MAPEAQRRAHLFECGLAVRAGDEEGELVVRLLDCQAFGVRPRIPDLAEARRDVVLEGLHLDVLCRAEWLREFDELREREAAPGDRHRPGLDAAMTIEPLLERHLADEIVDRDLERLLHHAV